MADEEAQLNDEIAKLEAELERARLESQLKHLQAELANAEAGGREDEVVEEWEDDEEYEEYSEEEEYIEEDEEYEEVYEEEECEEEYEEEEEVFEEEPVPKHPPAVAAARAPAPAAARAPAPAPAPARAPAPPPPISMGPAKLVYADIQKAQGNLRKAPVSVYQQKDAEAAARAAAAAPRPTPQAVPSQGRAVRKPKAKVRPPPEKGGKPKPRIDPLPAKKSPKKNPLSRLLQRNEKSTPAAAPDLAKPESAPETAPPKAASTVPLPKIAANAAATTEGAPKKKKVVKRMVRKKKPAAAAAAAAAAGGGHGSEPAPAAPGAAAKPKPGGPFKRRAIPNLQPSPAGEETVFEKLLGTKLITNAKMAKCEHKGCLKDQELIGLYVLANWKSDCKRFGPLLKDFYYNAAPHNNLEIVYVSADRSLMEFKDFYTTTPFLAMPAGTSSIKNELTKALKIIEMPALVILDEDGDVVTVEGVKKIQELERGNVDQANQLVERWKKTRPIPISEVQKDNTLLHGTMDRGYIYWN